ncbi:MAG TPA: D-alanyl-D-alanine carboxypeptidase family protein [Steroidobacteraceae bacterium]|jgi:D-alanyl-D-alanine carboxypeptidase (penicillin-binding protein 5/6)|nr:D-alanyl-D-alanine carboxypeptidase family protein [Steroidobacteraceae bacterium]
MIRRLLACALLSPTLLISVAASAAAPIPAPPSVPARAYLLEDFQTGRVLASDHADDRMEPASLTKLMTAYIVFTALHDGRLKLNDPVTISEHAWRSEGSRTFVQVGTQIPVDILIKGMIVQSGNDATVALAERVAGTEDAFVQVMNEYARRLGMAHTHFANSDGLPSAEHYTTARDLALLAHHLIADFPDFYPLFSLHEFSWNNIKQQNRNGLLGADPTVDGLKTGHTDSAGYCLVTSSLRNGMRLISVVLGSDSVKQREQASATLLGYGFSFYQTVKVKSRGDVLAAPRVFLSASTTAPVGIAQDLYVSVGRDQATGLKSTVTLEPRLLAPLAAGTRVGDFSVATPDGVVVAKVPVVALQAVPAGGLWTRMSDHISLWFK